MALYRGTFKNASTRAAFCCSGSMTLTPRALRVTIPCESEVKPNVCAVESFCRNPPLFTVSWPSSAANESRRHWLPPNLCTAAATAIPSSRLVYGKSIVERSRSCLPDRSFSAGFCSLTADSAISHLHKNDINAEYLNAQGLFLGNPHYFLDCVTAQA